MRIWSLSPYYLDSIGLVALWREGLLAQKVLLGFTKGYKNHPQLNRFRTTADPVRAIGYYLSEIEKEAHNRKYHFDAAKIIMTEYHQKIPVQQGQIAYEWQHLMDKLAKRSPDVYRKNMKITNPEIHPLFEKVNGGIADWERVEGYRH